MRPWAGRLAAAAGGVALIVSLFLPWAVSAGADRTGFELFAATDAYLLITGAVAVAAALTWGRYGLFRPDLSLNGAADLLALVATILLARWILFDFPAGAGRGIGAYLALGASVAIAAGVGDYSVLRGSPLFPRVDAEE